MPKPNPDLDSARRAIANTDQEIVQLLNERARAAREIAIKKDELGLPIDDPDREREVLQNVESHNQGPLRPEQVRRIFECTIEVTKDYQRKFLHERKTSL